MEVDYFDGDEDELDFDDESPIPIRYDASFYEIYKECLEPTFESAFYQVAWLLVGCLIFHILVQLRLGVHAKREFAHAASVGCGLVALFGVCGSTASWTVGFAVSSYVCLVLVAKGTFGPDSYKRFAFVLLSYMVVREYCRITSEPWEEIRGVQMIMVLKVLSLCFDVHMGHRQDVPPFLDYLGYIFCPASVVFGPWIPFDIYCQLLDYRVRGLGWMVGVFANGLTSFLFLGVSSCLVYWVSFGFDSRWVVVFREALSFRFSHYFISLMSETTHMLSVFPEDSLKVIEVTLPSKIEFPRSLVEVVCYWNKPMHKWLKVYIFRPASHLGTFHAVLATFLVSSALHGMNFGLTMVLLSLGLYTYVEHKLREKLSFVFDACICSRACNEECSHQFKSNNWVVMLVNFGFGLWAYFNLAYLGIMMNRDGLEYGDADEDIFGTISEDIEKWKSLNFISHWTMLAVYLGTIVI